MTCTVHEVGAESAAPGAVVPIGRPLAGGHVCILDRDGNAVPEGVPGELHVGGVRLARGYLGAPERTRERFVADPAGGGEVLYRTGDLACFLPGTNGLLAWRGRIDDQLKIRGFRIEPAEIEAACATAACRRGAAVPGATTAALLPPYLAAPQGAPRTHCGPRRPAPAPPPCSPPASSCSTHCRSRPAATVAAPRAPSLGRRRRAAVRAAPVRRPRAKDCSRMGAPCRTRQPRPRRRFFPLRRPFPAGAKRCSERLRRDFGRELTIADLLRAPTVAQQAALLRAAPPLPAAAANPLLVPLAAAGEREPLVLVHPVGGNVVCYLELARQLDAGRPVYGLQCGAPVGDIAAMAAAYLAALRELQPHGPYHLAGWSFGGAVAYEMAQQLRAAGESVAFLGLIDSYTPVLLETLEAVPGEDPGDEVRLARAFARDLEGTGAGSSAEAVPAAPENLRLFEIFRTHSLALRAWRPQPYGGTLTLLATTPGRQAEPTLGWGALAAGALVLHPVPGTHYSLLQAPHVQRLAEVLAQALGAPRTASTLQVPT